MSQQLHKRLFEEIDSWTLVDPHTHIDPHQPASRTLADILGYHYYTELAHSAGCPKHLIEGPEAPQDPRERVRVLVPWLKHLDNTVQYSWLVEMARELFDFPYDQVNEKNWEELYDAALAKMQQPDWEQQVLRQSKLEAVFLTNPFDDPLEGFDTTRYVPCLRTDDLVFRLHRPEVKQRLTQITGIEPSTLPKLRESLGRLFEHFVRRGARACAISLPPEFMPQKVIPGEVENFWQRLIGGEEIRPGNFASAMFAHAVKTAREEPTMPERMAYYVFWTLAELCQEFNLPFDLMIGVTRGVYQHGVFQGMDLFDSRVSLLQYAELWNAFPQVVFPVSVLASVTNQELVAYSWIFPNVLIHGHWWYSNTPSVIYRDLANRLEAVPRNKLLGYYSDMYKLEFALPKFRMYKRVLARVLARHFVLGRGWSEEQALDLARQVLIDNVKEVFKL